MMVLSQRFRRTRGFMIRKRLDIVSTQELKTAGRGSRQEIARHHTNRDSTIASRSHNSNGYHGVPDSQHRGVEA